MKPAPREAHEGKQVEIFGQQVTRIEYRGHQVVTFAMIDKLHGRPEETASKRFSDNRDRFEDGVDFFLIKKAQNPEFRSFGISVPNRGLTLITRRGYLKIVKSLNDDTAWAVFEDMLDRYFIVEEVIKAVAAEFQTELDLGLPGDSTLSPRRDMVPTANELKGALLGYLKRGMAPILDNLRHQVEDFRDRAFRGIKTIHGNVIKVHADIGDLNTRFDALEARILPASGERPIILSGWYGVSRIYRDLYRVDHVPRQGFLTNQISKSLLAYVLRSGQGHLMRSLQVTGNPATVWHISVVKPWFDATGYQMIEDHFARNMPRDRGLAAAE